TYADERPTKPLPAIALFRHVDEFRALTFGARHDYANGTSSWQLGGSGEVDAHRTGRGRDRPRRDEFERGRVGNARDADVGINGAGYRLARAQQYRQLCPGSQSERFVVPLLHTTHGGDAAFEFGGVSG